MLVLYSQGEEKASNQLSFTDYQDVGAFGCVFSAEPIKDCLVTLQLKLFLDLALLFFNSISSMGRGLSVHLSDLMIIKGKKDWGLVVWEEKTPNP